MNALAGACERNLPDTLEFHREIVAINSFTANAEGIRQNGERIAAQFERLGFSAEFFPAERQGYGPHLLLRREPPTENAPAIALLSHLDTVFAPEEEARNDFAWRRDGDRIYGPGSLDIKGGTVLVYLMLAAMRDASPRLFESVAWHVALNACEETDSSDFGRLCRRHLPKDTLACLIFEGDSGTNGSTLVRARKGRATFRVEVEGRGAHAGSRHANGANAAVQLARTLLELDRITSYENGVTVNIGRIEGGTVLNRVPHFAMAELEMRAFLPAEYEAAKQRILGCAGPGEVASRDGAGHACRISVTILDETPPWPENAASQQLAAIWQAAGRRLGLAVQSEQRGGLSDGNVLWSHFPTLDGLGPKGDNAHCSEQSPDGSKQQEWVDAASFVPKAILNIHALEELLRHQSANSLPSP